MKTLLITLVISCIAMTTIPAEAHAPSVHTYTMKTIDGAEKSLGDYKGRVMLIVNVASFCGYTKQYAGLEQLHKAYAAKGLAVVGFPANDFGAQEPGTDEEIKEFCSTKYNVSFDMFSKITVKGPGKHPLYAALTAGGAEVGWNFEKFLVGKDGVIIKRYKSNVEPNSAELKADIEAALAQ